MKKERSFIIKFFCEGNEPSSKRIVGIGGALVLYVKFFIVEIPSDTLIYAVSLLSFGALGITGAEKIFKNTKK